MEKSIRTAKKNIGSKDGLEGMEKGARGRTVAWAALKFEGQKWNFKPNGAWNNSGKVASEELDAQAPRNHAQAPKPAPKKVASRISAQFPAPRRAGWRPAPISTSQAPRIDAQAPEMMPKRQTSTPRRGNCPKLRNKVSDTRLGARING
ncbi:hypothetical protein PIB30_035274 [Stylosanthes scabra]|uniref:Uncharacterized protein n=1 Tax=Stylosanthes scabra TaxID=79078 RepID=A0ABU6XEM0_9FABA|nr:hypothetical protein [Stylosanthes scabra]